MEKNGPITLRIAGGNSYPNVIVDQELVTVIVAAIAVVEAFRQMTEYKISFRLGVF